MKLSDKLERYGKKYAHARKWAAEAFDMEVLIIGLQQDLESAQKAYARAQAALRQVTAHEIGERKPPPAAAPTPRRVCDPQLHKPQDRPKYRFIDCGVDTSRVHVSSRCK